MDVLFKPIGYVSTTVEEVPRFYKHSDVQGSLVIDEAYTEGLSDITVGQQINVIFYFNRSKQFDPSRIRCTTERSKKERGVFSTRSPVRPNPIGLSVLEVTGVSGNIIHVRGLDMFDGTPILDIKPPEYSVPDNGGT